MSSSSERAGLQSRRNLKLLWCGFSCQGNIGGLIGGSPGHQSRRLLAHTLLAGASLLAMSLWLYPPDRTGLYPLCLIHEYLHIQCPGCGATRALSALLHGQLLEALRLNALFVLLLPFALAVAAECYRRAIRPGEFRWPTLPQPVLYALLTTAATFSLVRNIAPLF